MNVYCCDVVVDARLEDINEDETETESRDEAGRFNYRVLLQRDKRRWARADVDGDGELSKEEFAAFVHPEDTDHMRDIVTDVRFTSSSYFLLVTC